MLPKVVLISGLCVGAVQAQCQIQPLPLRTKIEAFEVNPGTVIIRGSSKPTEMKGGGGGRVVVQSIELTDATSGVKQFGMIIDVVAASSNRSFVDYDEIAALLKAMDHLTKVDGTVTQLDDFRADYRTRGDLVVSVFTSPSGRAACISSSSITSTSSLHIRVTELPNFREIVANAKAQLDALGAH